MEGVVTSSGDRRAGDTLPRNKKWSITHLSRAHGIIAIRARTLLFRPRGEAGRL